MLTRARQLLAAAAAALALAAPCAAQQRVWILTATHLHEHLGQAIAYARTDGVVPPWSRTGS